MSADTVRRWRQESGWVWKRAQLVARDDAPHRIARLARMQCQQDYWQAHAGLVFADALDMYLLPKVRAAWRPQGTPAEVMTPGKNATHDRAGALPLAPGPLL